jgi:hypothetical protein
MALTYSAAPEVQRIADRLIKDEPEFRPLRKIRIEYLFRSEAERGKGKLTLGKARKVTGMNALLATPDLVADPEATSEHAAFFAMEIAHDTWELMNMRQREALIHHELCHFQLDLDEEGNVALWIKPHDVEVFASEVRKYGPWKMDLYEFFVDVGANDVIDLFNQGQPPAHFAPRPEGVGEDGEVIEGPWAAGQESEPEPPFT